MSNEQIDIFYSRDNLSNYFPTYRKDVLVAALRSSSTIARQNRIYSSIEQRTSEFQLRTCMSVFTNSKPYGGVYPNMVIWSVMWSLHQGKSLEINCLQSKFSFEYRRWSRDPSRDLFKIRSALVFVFPPCHLSSFDQVDVKSKITRLCLYLYATHRFWSR